MGKKKYTDPAVDQLAVISPLGTSSKGTPIDARSMFFSNLVSMGWRLAVMVLVPLFIGVQIDKRFDTSPNFTLGAFFIAIAGASYLIWKTYQRMQREQLLADMKKTKRKVKRSTNA